MAGSSCVKQLSSLSAVPNRVPHGLQHLFINFKVEPPLDPSICPLREVSLSQRHPRPVATSFWRLLRSFHSPTAQRFEPCLLEFRRLFHFSPLPFCLKAIAASSTASAAAAASRRRRWPWRVVFPYFVAYLVSPRAVSRLEDSRGSVGVKGGLPLKSRRPRGLAVVEAGDRGGFPARRDEVDPDSSLGAICGRDC